MSRPHISQDPDAHYFLSYYEEGVDEEIDPRDQADNEASAERRQRRAERYLMSLPLED